MFTLKLEEVNFEKIKSFCEEQNPEGETIEYKGDFPSDLEKSISAMANTYGGIILIGVEADKTKNTPLLPIKGIDLTKGLDERVTSICLRNIYQPYFPPIVKVCDFKNEKGEDRAVVFIRVHESDQTPHAINNNTDVYLRIRSQNEPIRKGTLREATLEEIDWLKNRRLKAVENRETLIKMAEQRFRNMPHGWLDNLKAHTGPRDLYSPYRKASIIPLFPSKPLLEYMELLNLRDTFNNSRDQVLYLGTPISSSGSLSCPLVQHDNSGNPVHINYTEFNIFGLVFNKQSLWENLYPETQELLDVSFFLEQIYRVVTVGTAIYEKAGYFGSVQIEVQVGGILGKRICVVENQRERYHWCINRIEPNIHITRICSFYQLNENLDGILIEICKEFLWSCGAGETVKEPETILKNLCKRARESYQ
jgi:hypothetical protein